MPNQQLIEYIKQARAAGQSDADIKSALLNAGWQEADIDGAFSLVLQSTTSPTAGFSSANNGNVLGPITLLKNAWRIYKSRFWVFLGLSALPLIIPAATFYLAHLFLPKSSLINFLLYLPLGLLYFWSYLALIFAIRDREEKINIIEAYRRSLRKVIPALYVSVLFWLIFIGGLLLLVLPGIIVFIWFGFAIFILVEEDMGTVNALLKSRGYVKGKWWKVFWRFIFMILFAFIASIAILISILVLSAILVAVAFFVFGINWIILVSWFALISFIAVSSLGLVANIIIMPLLLSYDYLLYKDLKFIRK